MLNVDGVIVAYLVQISSRDAGFDKLSDVIELLASEATGDAHFFDLIRCLDANAHKL